tara:strand:+ start:1387 stop:1692 length:306 start_codon:yes stop_codon:yes gene_type:complete
VSPVGRSIASLQSKIANVASCCIVKLLAFITVFCNRLTYKVSDMSDLIETNNDRNEAIIKEIVALEREYYFEKRNVKTERQRKLREVIEHHTKPGDAAHDS